MVREIVDESDVYVDVHKAIRRLAPAPRVHRIIHAEATASKAPDTPILVDVAPDMDDEAVMAGSYHDNDDAKTSIHIQRRTSDGGIEGPPVLVKAGLDEMRQQLRLGPANKAARPLNNTRASVFKTKQGLDASTRLLP